LRSGSKAKDRETAATQRCELDVVFRRPLNAYRSTGADPPFTDPAGARGTAIEGWY
jgi:hypothetical protein